MSTHIMGYILFNTEKEKKIIQLKRLTCVRIRECDPLLVQRCHLIPPADAPVAMLAARRLACQISQFLVIKY